MIINRMGFRNLIFWGFLFLLKVGVSSALTKTPPHFSQSRSPLSAASPESSRAFLPTVEFVDPQTGCKVVLLGCFHGTNSSSQDVKKVVTLDTDVVALELCSVRFADLRRQEEVAEIKRPWLVGYFDMISNTVQKRGLPTGLAAALLSGFSGLQSAVSGFVPGLEFKTAMDLSIIHECDIVLADQLVDETLRQIGCLPQISWKMNFPTNVTNTLEEWKVHSASLKTAIIGDESLPHVQLGDFLFRNTAAIQDLVRLMVPPISIFFVLVQVASSGVMADDLVPLKEPNALELLGHWFASAWIIFASFVGLTLPAIKVVITERDVVLANGIQAACKKAGNGGQVVAVLGFLHVNGVAKQMIENEI